jgi:hypothetical protein
VDHTYLTPEAGDRVVADAKTINDALGYEMNTIEFAVKDGVPYAIDFLNPAPDFERDRITQHYFDMVLDKMARLVIDRAVSGALTNPWPRWEQMVGLGAATSGVIGQPASAAAVTGDAASARPAPAGAKPAARARAPKVKKAEG